MSDKGHEFYNQAFQLWKASEEKDLQMMEKSLELYKKAIAHSSQIAHSFLAYSYYVVGTKHLQMDKEDSLERYNSFVKLSLEQSELAQALDEYDLPSLISGVYIHADAIAIRVMHQQAILAQTDWRPDKMGQQQNEMQTVQMLQAMNSELGKLMRSFSYHLENRWIHAIVMDFVITNMMELATYLTQKGLIIEKPLSEIYGLIARVDLDEDVSWKGLTPEMVGYGRGRLEMLIATADSYWKALSM